jgi:hypothetical protein
MLKRRKVDPHNCTLLELAYARTGRMLTAARVLAFVVAWAVVREELGREPTVEEYAEWWREPERTAYDQLETFREVFPGARYPGAVLDRLQGASVERSKLDWGELVAA